MENFAQVKNLYDAGLINNSQFIYEWDTELRNIGLAYSYDISQKLAEVENEYQKKLREIVVSILNKQGWLAQ